jgi:hypothetical protein
VVGEKDGGGRRGRSAREVDRRGCLARPARLEGLVYGLSGTAGRERRGGGQLKHDAQDRLATGPRKIAPGGQELSIASHVCMYVCMYVCIYTKVSFTVRPSHSTTYVAVVVSESAAADISPGHGPACTAAPIHCGPCAGPLLLANMTPYCSVCSGHHISRMEKKHYPVAPSMMRPQRIHPSVSNHIGLALPSHPCPRIFQPHSQGCG